MKKIVYNNYVKLAAFILCAFSISLSSFLITTNFLREENFYLFEPSFEESFCAENLVRQEFYTLSEAIEETNDENDIIHPENLRYMPSAEEWEYYITVNGQIYSNVFDKDYNSFKNSPFAVGVSVMQDSSGAVTRKGFTGMKGRVYHFLDTDTKNYELCVRMSDALINKIRPEWENVKYNADKAAKIVSFLLILATALIIYLLCVTGKTMVDGEIKINMLLIDKVFVEITAAAFLLILLGGGTLTVLGIAYFIIDENISIANQVGAATIFAVVSLSGLMLLSLVRNIRNGTFAERSLIIRFYRFACRVFKKIFNSIRRMFSEIKSSVLTVSAKHFDGRFVGIIITVFAAGVSILAILTLESGVSFLLLIIFVIAAVLFVNKRLIGFNNLKNGIEKIKNGELNHKITNCPDGVIGVMAENINTIGDGLQKSLDREVKAERMKSELITNVSHDIKTPLTSIINYADLLAKETLSPSEANDYVKIILQKGERLKQLTNDLFDISKVQSGNEEFNIEDIDICLLIEQAMAELNELIEKSGLVFKVNSTDKELFVKADGRKLSRVFENLLVNCVKYSMKNTRVYIDITKEEERTCVEIKNIAGYEMNFNADEIAERFVRGDSARSSEGSGLGLAIAKSYVEGSGGTFEITTDGDLFKVKICF